MTNIYCLEKDGIPFYIGRTQYIKERFATHKRAFGDDITYCILHECEKNVNFWEQHHIWLYRSYGFNLKNRRVIKNKINEPYNYEDWILTLNK